LRFARHFFVCTNQRPAGGKPSCGERGAQKIVAGLQAGLAQEPELCDQVSVIATACLGPCFEGPMLVVYPEGTWYCGVTIEDVPELVRAHLQGGQPVQRLMHAWSASPSGKDHDS
jgi:(2Fe-2S) ferredoxin